MDLLVDGPYRADLPEEARRWAGSTNQRFHFLTGRYSPGVEIPAPGEPDRTVATGSVRGTGRGAADVALALPATAAAG